MHTRKQYLNKEVSHSDYYGQFVTEQTKRLVVLAFGIETIKTAFENDPHFNNISLNRWDNLTHYFRCDKQMKECGDYATLAGKVCVLKETARRIALDLLD